jgi:hypothetical protein
MVRQHRPIFGHGDRAAELVITVPSARATLRHRAHLTVTG